MTEAELEARIATLEAELARLIEARRAGRRMVAAEVVDDEGRTRAMLTSAPGGVVALHLLDQEGNLRAVLGQHADGPTLTLLDPAGQRRLDLHIDADDVPRLVLADETGAKRVDAAVDAAGTASLGVLGRDGSARAVMMTTASGRGVVAASR